MYYNIDFSKEFNMDLINYTNPKKSSGGSYVSQCYFRKDDNTNVPIMFETPFFPFTELKLIRNKTFLQLPMSEETEFLFEFMEELRNYNIEYASQKSFKWFSKQLTLKHLKDYHKPLFEKTELGPAINLSLPAVNDQVNMNIVDFDDEKLKISQLENRKIKCIIKIDTIKFLRKELICNLSVVKIQAQKENVLDLIRVQSCCDLVINNVDP